MLHEIINQTLFFGGCMAALLALCAMALIAGFSNFSRVPAPSVGVD